MDVLIGIVTGAEVKVNRDGTLPGRLCQAVITDPEDVQTIEAPQGSDEFHPPNGCRLLILEAGPDCKMVVGYDDGIAPVMEAGGRRVYSLNTGGDRVMAEMQLKPDGTAFVQNDEGSITILPDGTIIARNKAVSTTLKPDGTATTANDGGSFTMDPNGNFTFHGKSSLFDHSVTIRGAVDMQSTLYVKGAVTTLSTIDASNTITAPLVKGTTDVKFGSKSAIGHTHGNVANGKGVTGVPT